MNDRINYLKNVKKVVIKVGTSTLTHSTGLLNLNRIDHLVRQIADIHNKGIDVVLVSSGAIGAGIGKLGLTERPKTIPEKQAAAAVGQGILLHMYEKLFSEYGKVAAQILLTRDDVSHRTRFLNARNTLFALLEQGVIPIVNENDAISIDEIKFGDNDTLSAMVANICEADLLILLTDIDGLYDSNPNTNSNAKLIKFVDTIDEDLENCAGDSGSNLGTGGMITKINAAKIATYAGSSMVIVDGSVPDILSKVLDGDDVGTLFKGNTHPLQARKHWMAFSATPNGHIIVDEGAEKAIVTHHKSLLPKGILFANGSFEHGDVVAIINTSNQVIGHGISNYSSNDIELIKGLDSSEIENKLGYKTFDVIIHANNMSIF